jgi:hypothetical protein
VRKKLAIASLPDEKCIFFDFIWMCQNIKHPATAPPLSICSRPGWLVWIDRGGTVATWLVFRYMHKMWEKNAFFVRQRSYGQFFIYLFMSLFFYMFSFCEWRIVLAGKKKHLWNNVTKMYFSSGSEAMAIFLFIYLFCMVSFWEWLIVFPWKKNIFGIMDERWKWGADLCNILPFSDA